MISAQCSLYTEGFQYTKHQKALYYDGHEWPDVVEYQQETFLPAMKEYRRRLVEYEIGNVEQEVLKEPENCVERRLVLVAHDESTS